MKLLRTLLPAFLLLAAVSCEFPFPLDNVSDPAIYIEYLPSCPYSTPRLNIAYADPAYGKAAGLHAPKPGDVSVSINGSPAKISPDFTTDGNMLTLTLENTELKSGDRIEVKVDGGSAPDAYACTTLPPLPELAGVEMIPVAEDTTGNTLKVNVKLAGEIKEGEYYGLRILERNTIVSLGKSLDTTVFYSYKLPGQVASREDLNSLDLDAFANAEYAGSLTEEADTTSGPMMLLTYKQFQDNIYSFYVSKSGFNWQSLLPEDFELPDPDDPDGQEIPAVPEIPEMPGEVPDVPSIVLVDNAEYVVELYRLSEELYNYYKAQYLMRFNLLSNFGVTPPNFTYSNVQGGLGIVGGLSGVRTGWL